MSDPLRNRIMRALEVLPEDKAYLVLDYVEFLESKYAARARPTNIFARLVDTVGDTMRAGRAPLEAISGTLGAMDSAQKLMKGLAAAGEAVIDELDRAVAPPPGGPPTSGSLPAGTRAAKPTAGSPSLPAGTQPPAPPPEAD